MEDRVSSPETQKLQGLGVPAVTFSQSAFRIEDEEGKKGVPNGTAS